MLVPFEKPGIVPAPLNTLIWNGGHYKVCISISLYHKEFWLDSTVNGSMFQHCHSQQNPAWPTHLTNSHTVLAVQSMHMDVTQHKDFRNWEHASTPQHAQHFLLHSKLLQHLHLNRYNLDKCWCLWKTLISLSMCIKKNTRYIAFTGPQDAQTQIFISLQ